MPILGPISTRKFSEFVAEPVDDVVGLTAGANAIGPNSGGGGSGDIIVDINQDVTGLAVGNWVRIDNTGKYVPAQANNGHNAEVEGVVRSIVVAGVAGTFQLQQAGFIPSGTPGFSGFTNFEDAFFLSDATPGLMTQTQPVNNGSVTKPVFKAHNADSGWVICLERGAIIGSPPPIIGGVGGNDTSIHTVNQPRNTFLVGDWVRVTGENVYGLADGTTLANAQAAGVVIVSGNPNFTIQFSGHNTNTVTKAYDAAGVLIPEGIVASTVYYISDVVPGQLTPFPPTGLLTASKPAYISESVVNDSGWVLPQRPLPHAVAIPGASPPVFLGRLNAANNFSSQTILTDSNGNTFGAYQYVINSNKDVSVNYGIRGTGPGPVSVGLQFFIDGAWQTTPGNYASYISGVNSTAGVNTATLWGYVVNVGAGVGRDMVVILPPTSTLIGLVGGNGILTTGNGATVAEGQYITVDLAPATPIGYTSEGFGGCDAGIANATGMRVAFGNGGTLVPGSASYISVYGLPNS